MSHYTLSFANLESDDLIGFNGLEQRSQFARSAAIEFSQQVFAICFSKNSYKLLVQPPAQRICSHRWSVHRNNQIIINNKFLQLKQTTWKFRCGWNGKRMPLVIGQRRYLNENVISRMEMEIRWLLNSQVSDPRW